MSEPSQMDMADFVNRLGDDRNRLRDENNQLKERLASVERQAGAMRDALADLLAQVEMADKHGHCTEVSLGYMSRARAAAISALQSDAGQSFIPQEKVRELVDAWTKKAHALHQIFNEEVADKHGDSAQTFQTMKAYSECAKALAAIEKEGCTTNKLTEDHLSKLRALTEDECTCGGNPADDPACCPACRIYHRIAEIEKEGVK